MSISLRTFIGPPSISSSGEVASGTQKSLSVTTTLNSAKVLYWRSKYRNLWFQTCEESFSY